MLEDKIIKVVNHGLDEEIFIDALPILINYNLVKEDYTFDYVKSFDEGSNHDYLNYLNKSIIVFSNSYLRDQNGIHLPNSIVLNPTDSIEKNSCLVMGQIKSYIDYNYLSMEKYLRTINSTKKIKKEKKIKEIKVA